MSDTEHDLSGFLHDFRRAIELAHQQAENTEGERFADAVSAHLGQPAREVPVLTEEVPNHRFADWDLALELLAQRDPDERVLGVGGGDMRYHQTLADYLSSMHMHFPVGQVDYVSAPVGPDAHRRAIGLGMRLFRFDGRPVGVFHRRGNPRFGQTQATFEVLCADQETAARLLGEARALATERSVLRGQVISFESSGFGMESEGITFLPRPDVTADQVVLPASSLERIAAHVSGIAEHAQILRRHGQHLKRGLLLYGPPGTGKTHTVRHLVSRTRDIPSSCSPGSHCNSCRWPPTSRGRCSRRSSCSRTATSSPRTAA